MNLKIVLKKSCIQETKNLSTDADSTTDTILERLCDLTFYLIIFEKKKKIPGKPQKSHRKTQIKPRESAGKPPGKPWEKFRENPGRTLG